MSRLFGCQEIGSIDKLSFRTKAARNEALSQRDVEEALAWGKRVGVTVDRKLLEKRDKTKEDVQRIKDLSSLLAIKFFETAGLDIVYDGEQKRTEMYQHPITNSNGFTFLGHMRSFDDKYYNIASCIDKVSLKRLFHTDEMVFIRKNTKRLVKVPITGAATLGYWSDNQFYQQKWNKAKIEPRKRTLEARREFILDIAREIIRPNIKSLVSEGAEMVQVDEPAATMFTTKEDLSIFVEAFNESVKGVNATFSMHICFSDYGVLFPHILEMKKCAVHSWEFANRDSTNLGTGKEDRPGYEVLGYFSEYGYKGRVGLGVINVHSDFVLPPELIRDRVLYAAGVLGPEKVLVNPDCGLRTRTWNTAYNMLSGMSKGAALARAAV